MRLLQPEDSVKRIQAGDNDLRERFLADSLPFIRSVVRKLTRSFFVDDKDEFSIALEAFNHAIDRFHADGDVPFEPFARLLMRNQIFNWIRNQKEAGRNISLTDCETDDGIVLEARLADPAGLRVQQNLEFEEAMTELELRLGLFGLSFRSLADRLPRHRDTRLLCIRQARILEKDADLFQAMMQNRRLPCAELARRSTTPVKTIEKNRAAIILFALLLRSDLDEIHSYIAAFEEGSK